MDGSGDISKRLPPQDYDVIRLLLHRFDRAARGQQKWAEEAKQCIEFFEGDQWTEEDRQYLEQQGRPILTINKIRRLLMLVWGYHRQEEFEPTVVADNDNIADESIAKVLGHLLKGILDNNHYQWLEEEVFQDGTQTGRGWLDVRLDFTRSIYGDIKIKSLDPARVYPDPDGDTYDPDTWNHVSVSTWMGLQQIMLLYGVEAYYAAQNRGPMPLSSVHDVTDGDDTGPESYFGLYKWFGEDGYQSFPPHLGQNILVTEHYDKLEKKIRVIEQQHKKLKRIKYFAVIATGELIEIPELWDEQRIAEIMVFAREKAVEIQIMSKVEHRIRWTVTAGDVLLYDAWSPYDHFTVVPFFPYFRRGKTRGLVADLIDPQREINKRRSSIIHIIATTANSGWQVWEDTLDPDELDKLRAEGSKPGYVMVLKKETPNEKKPVRIEPGIPPTSVEKMELAANVDLKEVTGITDSALGQVDQSGQSGVAIQNRQRQTVVGLEMYMDNLDLSRAIMGRNVLSIIQRFFTERRLIRTLNVMGEPQEQIINDVNAVGEIVNDVTIGRYRVAVNSVPATDTFQQRQFQELLELARSGVIPPMLLAPTLIDASTVPYKEQLKAAIAMAFGTGIQPGGAPGAPGAGGAPGAPQPGAGGPPPNG